MRIGVDTRSLAEPQPGGVTHYTRELLTHLLKVDQENEYVLFYNGWSSKQIGFSGSRVDLKITRWPNKIFNSALYFLKYPKIDKLIGPIDLFFIPNINFISIDSEIPIVLTIHDLSFEIHPYFLPTKRRLWHRFVSPRRLVDRASRIIAVSENTKKDLMSIYQVPEGKINVIYSGISLAGINQLSENIEFEILNKYKIKQPYIFSLCSLEPRKNISTLLTAFDEIKNRLNLPHQLILVGPPAGQHSFLEQTKRGLRHPEAIKFLGYISNQEKTVLLKRAEVFVYPSIYEGFGFPPLESLAVGTPVIASASASLPEVIGDSVLLFNPYNISELTHALVSVLTDEKLRARLIQQKEDLESKYNWTQTAKQTLELFKSVVN